MKPIESEISEAFSLLGVLLVFVFAYGSALVPLVVGLLEQATPSADDDRAAFVGKLKAYYRLAWGFIVVEVSVALVIAPLSRRVLASWRFSDPFSTTKAGLLLVDVLLLFTVGVGIALERSLSERINNP